MSWRAPWADRFCGLGPLLVRRGQVLVGFAKALSSARKSRFDRRHRNLLEPGHLVDGVALDLVEDHRLALHGRQPSEGMRQTLVTKPHLLPAGAVLRVRVLGVRVAQREKAAPEALA